MKFLTILALMPILASCVKSPEVVEEGRSTASVNPEAPYLWTEFNSPKSLVISDNFAADEVAAIKDMATAWKTAVSNRKTFFNVSPTLVNNKSNHTNPDLLYDNLLGVYKTTVWPSDIPADALAVTQIFGRRYNVGKENEYVGIEHADILVNYEWHRFDTDDDPAHWDSDYDFQTVMVHELGHFLGLGHIDREEDRASSVMYPSITTREQKQVPQSRDANALIDRYDINMGAVVGNAVVRRVENRYVPRDNDAGVEARIILELRANGDCIHRENGAILNRHTVNLKK